MASWAYRAIRLWDHRWSSGASMQVDSFRWRLHSVARGTVIDASELKLVTRSFRPGLGVHLLQSFLENVALLAPQGRLPGRILIGTGF